MKQFDAPFKFEFPVANMCEHKNSTLHVSETKQFLLTLMGLFITHSLINSVLKVTKWSF